jgi:cephalosporin-C deacetylase-like acetyl esterase
MPWTPAQRRLLFAYDADLPLDVSLPAVSERDGLRVEHFSFASTHQQRVPAVLYRPAESLRVPLVVVGHGAGGGKDEGLMTSLLTRMSALGAAVLAIDAPLHGERQGRFEDLRGLLQQPIRGLHFVVQTVVDTMRAVDWAATRPNLDTTRLAYLGLSMGSILGVPFVALDERVRAACFALGGAGIMHFISGLAAPAVRADAERVAEAVDPMHYAPLIAPRPVLMVNGLRDQIIPAAAGHVLFGLLGEPKRIIWYDGGHGDIPRDTADEMRAFFASHLAQG